MRVLRWLATGQATGRRKIGVDGLTAVLLTLALGYGLDPRLVDPGVVTQKLPAGQAAVEAVRYLPVAVWWTASAVMIAAVAVRSRLPLVALAIATAGQLVHLGFTPFLDNAVDVAPALALYTVAARITRRAVSIGVAAAAIVAVAVTLFEPNRAYHMSSPLLRQWPVLLLAAAWLVGDAARARRLYASEVEARTRDLQQQQKRQAESLVAAERARIAREMHDVVAHGLSVIVIQAQAAAQAMDREPAVARAALDAIVDNGRGALGEMRRLFDLEDAGDADDVDTGTEPRDRRAPLPGLGDLPDLVDRVRAAGLPVTLAIEGPDGAVPAGPGSGAVPALLGLSAYRIVQEGLTNTLKHAGPGARAEVSVRYAPTDVQISVADTGGTPVAPAESAHQGRGLQGMRERVNMFGGQLRTGPGPHGGFQVYARLPFEVRT
jgi:signal transduction histidine kinase